MQLTMLNTLLVDGGHVAPGSTPISTQVDYLDFTDTGTATIRRIEVRGGEERVVESPLGTGADHVWLRDIIDTTVYKLQIADGVETLSTGTPGAETVYDSIAMNDQDAPGSVYDLVVSNGEIQLILT